MRNSVSLRLMLLSSPRRSSISTRGKVERWFLLWLKLSERGFRECNCINPPLSGWIDASPIFVFFITWYMELRPRKLTPTAHQIVLHQRAKIN